MQCFRTKKSSAWYKVWVHFSRTWKFWKRCYAVIWAEADAFWRVRMALSESWNLYWLGYIVQSDVLPHHTRFTAKNLTADIKHI